MAANDMDFADRIFTMTTTPDPFHEKAWEIMQGADPSFTQAAIAEALRTIAAESREIGRREGVEAAVEPINEWLRQYADTKIDHVSADKYARDAVADIRDAVLALLPAATGEK